MNNYCPISILPLISKLMDCAVQKQLIAFLTENDVLLAYQSGFQKCHSTETAGVFLSDYILENMDSQKMTGAVFIDLKKAFDLVDHYCLLLKLEHYGNRGQSYNWFANYLAERSQRMKYRGELSSNLFLHHGVPQGSILGLLLFVLYINDLPQCLSKSQISMYADDTVIYFSCTKSSNIEVTFQSDINKVEQWLLENRLVLNQ